MSAPDLQIPLSSDQLKLIAAWASGDRGRRVYFDLARGRLVASPTPPDGGTSVAAFTSYADPDRPPVKALEVAATAAQGRLGLAEDADALFWSDGAVTKFLYPFYASLTGRDAQDQLAALSDVWQRYPAISDPTPVNVFALAHRPVVEEVSPDESVLVVLSREDPASPAAPPLESMSVSRFRAEFSGSGTVSPVELPMLPLLQTQTSTPFTAGLLRTLAEWAAGLPGQMLYFGFDGKGIQLLSGGDAPQREGMFVVPVWTEPSVPARPPLKHVVLAGAGGAVELADVADALFWSEGAVEQFLLPYYAWKGGTGAAASIRRLLHVWDGGPFMGERGEVAEVIALAHLPKSEYVSEPGGAASLGVVHVRRPRGGGPGAVELLTLETFIARYAPGA